MAIIYATLIIKGKKTFADVPDRIKDKVKEVLVDLQTRKLSHTRKQPPYDDYITSEAVVFAYRKEERG